MTFFVETFRPFDNVGNKSIHVRVHKEKEFCRDVLSPSMTAVFKVEHVKRKEEAIACCIEKLAGKGVCVSQVF